MPQCLDTYKKYLEMNIKLAAQARNLVLEKRGGMRKVQNRGTSITNERFQRSFPNCMFGTENKDIIRFACLRS